MTLPEAADFTPSQILALSQVLLDEPSISFCRPGDWPFLVLPVSNDYKKPDGWDWLEWDEAVAWAKEHINA